MGEARVVIADDHILVREGLRKLLELDSNIKVIDEVGDGQGAINIARKEKPDIVIMDVNMPGTDGIMATEVIKRELPTVRVIALTVYEGQEVVDMIKAGASAYILKDVAGSELVDTIHRVMDGEVVIYPRVANRLVRELRQKDNRKNEIRLTKREKDVLSLLVKGNTNKEMAELLFISEKTVKNHLTSIFRKLGVKDRTHAAIYALKNRIVNEE